MLVAVRQTRRVLLCIVDSIGYLNGLQLSQRLTIFFLPLTAYESRLLADKGPRITGHCRATFVFPVSMEAAGASSSSVVPSV